MKAFIVVPTYNEADNIAAFVAELFKLNLPDLNVLIADDESPDGTGQIADQLATQNPDRLFVLHRSGLRGLGRAYVDGFRWAIDHGADRIIQMDAEPEELEKETPSELQIATF